MDVKDQSESPNMAAEDAYWTPTRRRIVLLILCLIGMCSFIDRQIITVLLQPIKEEFGATDTQMGLLTGVAFAAFYAVAGIPIARLADVGSRKLIIAACVTFWSLMTSLAGIATGFWMLAASRVGVAIGEAGAGPTSQSILMDLFPLKRRGAVIGLLLGTQAIGIGLGVFLGGLLSDAFGWRAAFLIVGVPGLLLAGATMLFIREPLRGFSEPVRAAQVAAPPLGEVLKRLFSTPTYVLGLVTVGIGGIASYAMLGWGPTFMVRVHHMNGSQVGVWIGGAMGLALFAGITLNGVLADWAARKDMRRYLWIAAISPLLSIPLGLWFMWATDWRVAVFAFFAMALANSGYNPLTYVVAHTVSPVRMRAVSSVVMGVVNTVIGIGIGPMVIGMLNDFLAPRYGDDAIRYSLSVVTIGWLVATATAVAATFFIKRDYERLQREIADAAAT